MVSSSLVKLGLGSLISNMFQQVFQLTVLITLLGLAVCIPVNDLYLPPKSNSDATASVNTSAVPDIGPGNNLLNNSLDIGISANVANANSISKGQVITGSLAGATAEAFTSNGFKQVPILRFSTDSDSQSTYSYSYEASNSISAEEKGDASGDGTKARGSYSFTLPNGEHVFLTYTADENGFVAQGSHIPTAPPMPEAIQKALEENAAAEARGIFDDGRYHGEGLEESQYKSEDDSDNVVVVDAKSIVKSSDEKYAANNGYKY